MYQPPKPPSLWSEFWTLTRVVYGILLWPLLAILGVLFAMFGIFVLFTIHFAFGLLAIAAVVLVLAVLARWESRRARPPGV
jgi:ABC-type protease/lipase transport system fused ATPase/permease subunit